MLRDHGPSLGNVSSKQMNKLFNGFKLTGNHHLRKNFDTT